jgi:MYND finger
MNLRDRPSVPFDAKEVFDGISGLEVFQFALQLAWDIYPDYDTGMHMTLDFLAEKATNEDLQKLTPETMATLKAMATAKTHHPMWSTPIGPGGVAAALLDRFNRKVSFAQASFGSHGHYLRNMEAIDNAPNIFTFLQANPKATDAEVEAERERLDHASAQPLANMVTNSFARRTTGAAARGDAPRGVCCYPPCPAVDSDGSDGSPLQRCSACKKAKYCSRTCQLKHWKDHKAECKATQELNPALARSQGSGGVAPPAAGGAGSAGSAGTPVIASNAFEDPSSYTTSNAFEDPTFKPVTTEEEEKAAK